MATKEQLKELARGIVLAQGNLFIKELLRSKDLRIGVTKSEFMGNMLSAIDEGLLTEEDFEIWLGRVEGWGNQYAYLYNWSTSKGEDWTDPKVIRAAVRRAKLLELVDAPGSLAFPKEMSLTGVYYEPGRLRAVWHKGFESMVRDTSRDYEEVIDDDRYEFRAYRERSERSVMRFDLRCQEGIAGAFLQVPASSDDHQPAFQQMMDVANSIVGPETLTVVDIAQIMRRLEDAELQGGHEFTTQQSRYSGPGAYVEFGADDPETSYQDVDVIRNLRLALPTEVVGTRARMRFHAPGEEGPARLVGVNLYAIQNRIWLRSQMTEGQVWNLIDFIRAV
ncbi:MAG: hypothetical protein ACRDI3_03250 [Actinomycetota bacterium]